MKTRKKLTLKFYQNLGKLFYAIAAADHEVRNTEFEKLKELIKSHWLQLDQIEDRFNTDAAYQIEIVFDWLNNQKGLDAKKCFNDFIDYKNKQRHLFTNNVKQLILKTGSAIAASFSGINKSELIILAKLDMELKKI
jgi:hypothetical protein